MSFSLQELSRVMIRQTTLRATENYFWPTRTLAGARAATIRLARTRDPISVSPVRRQTHGIEIDPVLPPSQQMVELTAASGSDVEWFVNGARVAPERDGRFFWQLTAGEWHVRAVSRNKLIEQKITVEGVGDQLSEGAN